MLVYVAEIIAFFNDCSKPNYILSIIVAPRALFSAAYYAVLFTQCLVVCVSVLFTKNIVVIIGFWILNLLVVKY
jgi:hypothetical protein